MAVLSLSKSKLKKLCSILDVADPEDLIEPSERDNVSPAICMNEGCNFTCEMETDEARGRCPKCGTNTMKSALVLACLI
jgi:hypothetical protein